MKKLALLCLLLMTACNSQQVADQIEAGATAPDKKVGKSSSKRQSGELRADICEPDGRRGYRSFKVMFLGNQILLTAMHSVLDDCSINGEYDRTYAYYELDDNGQYAYLKTLYTDMAGSDSFADCGLPLDVTGVGQNIDGIGCDLSYENEEPVLDIEEHGDYVTIGDVVFE